MRYCEFRIKGVFSETNRKRTINIQAQSESEALETAKAKGLLEPFEVEVLPHQPPTENQLKFASVLGIAVPENATFEDLQCLISRKQDNDSDPNSGLLKFAFDRKIYCSDYIGKKRL